MLVLIVMMLNSGFMCCGCNIIKTKVMAVIVMRIS